MESERLYRRFRDLQQYVDWCHDDVLRVRGIAQIIEPHVDVAIDDFYDEINRHEATAKVITGGPQQIERLKTTLRTWLSQLFAGPYDQNYVESRWRVGMRHVEIGLDQVYTSAAMSRLRGSLTRIASEHFRGDPASLLESLSSLHKLLDLDLAIIDDAYESEYLLRQRRVERQRSEATFGDLVEAAECMVVILRNDRTIAYFSRFAETLTGYPAAEVLGRDYDQVFQSQSPRDGFGGTIHEVLSGRSVQGSQSDVICRDGRRHTILWNARRLEHYEDEPVVLAVGQDITSLQEAQAQALRSERLAVIGQMVTGLAHESRNALQRIQACSEMLELEVENHPDALDLVRRIQNAQDHMHRLFDELRGYAAPIKLDRTRCSLRGIWGEAWELLMTRRGDRCATLSERTGGVDLTLSVDRFRLVQVFRNLLENSLAACDDPVEIVVQCRQTQHEGGAAVEIAVRDNGPGLSAEQQARIFQPFFTTKTKGTGLGMSIAQRIVEAHQGTICVGQCQSTGTEISITLPRDAP